MKKKLFGRILAWALTLAVLMTSGALATVNTAFAATDLSRIYVTGFNTSIKIREGEKLTSSLFKKLKVQVKGQIQTGKSVTVKNVKCKELNEYIHSKNGKFTLHLASGKATTSISVPVKVQAKKLTVKVKGTLPEGQILTDVMLLKALKASVTYKDGKKVSNFKGYTCKKIGSVVKSSNGKIKLPVAVGNVKKTVTVKVNKIQRIFIGNCKLLATGITEGTSVEEIEKSFRKGTSVYANYAKGANKKLTTYSVKMVVSKDAVVVTVKYGKFSDKISIPVIATPAPTTQPSAEPSVEPSQVPTDVPASEQPSTEPSQAPTAIPTATASASAKPRVTPSVSPSVSPSAKPTETPKPTITPGGNGGGSGSGSGSWTPSKPSTSQTPKPSATPTTSPSAKPKDCTVKVSSTQTSIKMNGVEMNFTNGTATETVPTGTQVTLSATDAGNSRFVRWINEAGKELSTSKTYTFPANENIAITAVFEGVYNLTVVREGGKGKVTLDGTSLDFYSDVAETKQVPGSYTLEAISTDDYQFVNWTNSSGFELSNKSIYTLNVAVDTKIIANFVPINTAVTVTYQYDSGALIDSKSVKYGETLATPTNVYKVDNTFKGWKIGDTLYSGNVTDPEFYNGSEKLSDAIKTLTAAKQPVTIVAYFEPNQTYYSVNITGGTLKDEKGNVLDPAQILSGTHVYLVPNVPLGEVFNGWKENGEIITYKENYDFYIRSNRSFELVSSEAVVPAEPKVLLRGSGYTADAENGSLSILTTIDLPAGYKNLEWGILVSTKLDNFDYDTEGILKVQDTDANAIYSTYADSSVTLASVDWLFAGGITVRAMAYAKIQGPEGTKTIYSSMIKIPL